jgi:hypothetical protein
MKTDTRDGVLTGDVVTGGAPDLTDKALATTGTVTPTGPRKRGRPPGSGTKTQPPAAPANAAAMFMDLAKDPNVSIEKIERLTALYERSERARMEADFNRAMSACQSEMEPVRKDATNPSTSSRYASYEALDAAIRPIYTKYGFALSYNTDDSPVADHVRVLCDVTQGGFAKQFRADLPADGKGAKGGDVMTRTHAFGSALTYGMRYLLKLIFNIAVGEGDDDGNRAGRTQAHLLVAPDGFDNWLTDMVAASDSGWPALAAAWNGSRRAFRDYLSKTQPDRFELLKARATDVDRGISR